MFKIGIVGGPCEKYIEKCITSFLNQEEKNWEIQIVLDPVDNAYKIAKKYEDKKIKIFQNNNKKNAVHNHVLAFSKLDCKNEDIIVTMDADDWLSSEHSLSIVKSYYQKFPDTLVTHGSWVGYPDPNIPTNCYPYTDDEWKKGIRNLPLWKATQLRTMKYKIWKNIDVNDLKDDNGDFFTFCGDLAYMFPALEMAGQDRTKFISEVIYVYNKETPYNEMKINLNFQQKICKYIRCKKCYEYKKYCNNEKII